MAGAAIIFPLLRLPRAARFLGLTEESDDDDQTDRTHTARAPRVSYYEYRIQLENQVAIISIIPSGGSISTK